MSQPAIEIGDKLHIITRRRFENDIRRHFAGEVIGISGELHSVQGYAFVYIGLTGEWKKYREIRTRLFSTGQDGFIVNKLPSEVKPALLEYRVIEKRLVVTDGGTFFLDINEFAVDR